MDGSEHPIVGPLTFGEALGLLRRRAKLRQGEAARLSGVPPRTLSRYESGQTARPDPRILRRIVETLARALDEDPAQLFAEIVEILAPADQAGSAELAPLDVAGDVLAEDLDADNDGGASVDRGPR